mmetsp:Transcript_114341/g.330323  ORF Transcript_114341/g.330323 Transcript_114341/m.330323 type:complete len:205 (-) Transcript_114341:114-728(-)
MAGDQAPEMPQIKMSQFIPMFIMLGLGKIDLDEMGYRPFAEIFFGVVQILCCGVMGLIYKKIDAMSDDGTKINIPEVKQMGQVVSPATKQTPKEYDMAKIKDQIKQAVMGAVIVCGIYYKWRYLMPLVLQVVMTPLQLYESPLFQVHLLGREVKRPYPTPNPFGLPSAPPAPEPTSGKKEKEVKDKDAKEGKEGKKEAEGKKAK